MDPKQNSKMMSDSVVFKSCSEMLESSVVNEKTRFSVDVSENMIIVCLFRSQACNVSLAVLVSSAFKLMKRNRNYMLDVIVRIDREESGL